MFETTTILSTDDFSYDEPVVNRPPPDEGDTAKEMMASMELLGPDGRVVYRGGYLTDSGVEERFAAGTGPYPSFDVDRTGAPDQVVGVATGELYAPPETA